MKRATGWTLLLWVLVIGAAVLFSATGLVANEKSHNGRDFVQIRKITPRTAADLPTPTMFPYTLEVAYTLKSSARGKLRVGVFRLRPGQPASQGVASGFEPLITPVEKPITKGSGTLTLTTSAVSLKTATEKNAQVVVVVNVQDAAGKEVCWATSHNFLRGTLWVRPETAPPVRDSLQVLSFLPRVGTLKTGHSQAFTVNMQYSLKTRPWGFVNLEFGERGGLAQSGPWYSVTVPVRTGTGLVKVTTRDFFLPAAYANKQMEMAVPFRIEPLGGTIDILRYGPWALTRPDAR